MQAEPNAAAEPSVRLGDFVVRVSLVNENGVRVDIEKRSGGAARVSNTFVYSVPDAPRGKSSPMSVPQSLHVDDYDPQNDDGGLNIGTVTRKRKSPFGDWAQDDDEGG